MKKIKQKKWTVSASVVGSKYLGTVTAPTKEAAIEAAYEMESAHISLCHQCAGECEDAEIREVFVNPEE